MRTLQRNLKQHLPRMEIALMAPTIAEAVMICFETGINFLWVDALCIFQDDENDLTTELAKMADIFAGAVCTFSIPSAKSSRDGFLRGNPVQESFLLESAIEDWMMTIYHQDNDWHMISQPLHKRGWTLQETLLSPVLISVTPGGIPWQYRCKTLVCNTDGGKIVRLPRILEYGSSTAPSDS
jgi:hypothetical protein